MTLPLTQAGLTQVTCNACHTANPGSGSNRVINPELGAPQPLKTPQLRNIYQKLLRNPFFTIGSTGLIRMAVDGFGLDHDGGVSSIQGFLAGSIFNAYTATQKADIGAYLLCFDTGTAPAVGYTRTVTPANLNAADVQTDWTLLESQDAAGNIDLIARGTINGVLHGLLYHPLFNTYTSDTNISYTRARLQALIQNGDTLTFMGVFPHTGSTSAIGH
jgi:hypothetical protein